jgi:anthranilate/para-aminobenzoate synthase component I
LIHDEDGWSVSVGGGIVADSEADREIMETWEKVSVFNHILGNREPSDSEQAG